MAIKEQDKVFYEELANGDKVINLPVTRVNNVEGIGRSASTAYSVGDVVYVDNNKKVALKCTQAGTTSISELDVSTASIGNVITDGSVVWQVCNRTSDVTSVNGKTGDVVVDLPVGHMYWCVEPNVPAGRLPAMGATYNRALYADLWAWANSVGLVKSESEWQAIASANDGNCAYYSSGDGSTTFRVPSIKCWVKGASGIEEVGSYLEAGLPNATGKVDATGGGGEEDLSRTGATYTSTGALKAIQAGSNSYSGYNSSRGTYWRALELDLSESNSIYGNAATVQPPSIVGMWLIVAFGVAHNIGEADVANVMQAIESTQTTISTVDNKITGIADYIVESYRNGTEWYEVYKSGKVRQGGTLTIANNVARTITFLKAFANTNYQKNVTHSDSSSNTVTYARFGYNKTSTSMIIYGAGTIVDWVAEGQGA